MPIYEFKCKKCGEITENLQKYEDPNPQCEHCQNLETERILSVTAPIRKGAGIYSYDIEMPKISWEDK